MPTCADRVAGVFAPVPARASVAIPSILAAPANVPAPVPYKKENSPHMRVNNIHLWLAYAGVPTELPPDRDWISRMTRGNRHTHTAGMYCRLRNFHFCAACIAGTF